MFRFAIVIAFMCIACASPVLLHAAPPPVPALDVLVTPTPSSTALPQQTISGEDAIALVIEQQRMTNNILLFFLSATLVVLVFSWLRVRM